MTDKNIQWTKTARSDLDEIISHITADSVENALDILDRLEHRAANLKRLSHRGRIVPELHDIGVNHNRELIEAPWRIIYRTESSNVFVTAILDSRRDLETILLHRLVRT
jgi:toxin ParE1/3/4